MSEEPTSQHKVAPVLLWSDDPAPEDLLAFNALAETLVDPLLDENLDPIALGLSGPWGSGKSTVLGLIQHRLEDLNEAPAKILVVPTQPWRYDPGVGAKETLIGEVISALEKEIDALETPKDDALKLVRKLAGRIEWAKAIKIAAKASIALQIPSVDELVDLVKPRNPEPDDDTDRSLDAFREEFAKLMASDQLEHLRAVVVLVDDLDRCLPRTVVESLEAIRLFLAVPKMSFVIAADEKRVADALRVEFPRNEGLLGAADSEDPAELYLHKIVQTTLPVPALSRFDTQAYILLLQVQASGDVDQLSRLTELCDGLRKAGGSLDDLAADVVVQLEDEITFAARLTPLLYEKLRGNPRRIKRFLNDLSVRRSVAERRGIELDPAVVAKLMVLEVLFRDEFTQVLDWLAEGNLRSQIAQLEMSAGRPESVPDPDDGIGSVDPKEKTSKGGASTPKTKTLPKEEPGFSEELLRWAKLPPSLKDLDLAPYLYLAASFKARPLFDQGLPERLKDLASNMLASTRRERQAVRDDDLRALPSRDVEELTNHLGRLIRDQPSKQTVGVTALLRIARLSVGGASAAAQALQMLPVDDVTIGTPLLFSPDDPAEVLEVLTAWKTRTANDRVRAAIDEALKPREAR